MQSPLLSANHPLPFDTVKADQVVAALTQLVTDARKKISEIATDSAKVTFENCLLALEQATEPLEVATSVVEHLESVACL
jgi:oligopeptidase A